ncbi:hypothetical protein [Thiohalocapsa marina]|nr:hypothetical protein [Thiohalocapsa marina]
MLVIALSAALGGTLRDLLLDRVTH